MWAPRCFSVLAGLYLTPVCAACLPQTVLAKALYDNAAESPEELAFRKGDILSVIEQNTGGLEGWWLCSLHGRQGIAPGNRLKLLIGPLFEAQAHPTPARAPSPSPAALGGPAAGYQQQGAGVYQVPPSPQQEVYQVPQRSAALLATPDTTPNRVRRGEGGELGRGGER